jgi:hypothetical protein
MFLLKIKTNNLGLQLIDSKLFGDLSVSCIVKNNYCGISQRLLPLPQNFKNQEI